MAALAAAGLPVVFTQTGGMCAALEVRLEAGYTLLVTDAEETLAWDREQHQGLAQQVVEVGLFWMRASRLDGLIHAALN